MERIARGFIIRHKVTGHTFGDYRSGSRKEPENPSKRIPRIFKNVLSARGFLSQWGRGHLWSDSDGSVHVKKVSNRNTKDFEIVEVSINIID